MSDGSNKSRSIWEMLSDYFREASVLIIVFGFLDKVFNSVDNDVDAYYGFKLGGLAFAIFCLGIFCEFMRTWKGE